MRKSRELFGQFYAFIGDLSMCIMIMLSFRNNILCFAEKQRRLLSSEHGKLQDSCAMCDFL